jgi:hypothetical protein
MTQYRKPGVAQPYYNVCWAEVRMRGRHSANWRFVQCGRRPRTGKLTCSYHADREKAAQRLKQQESTP